MTRLVFLLICVFAMPVYGQGFSLLDDPELKIKPVPKASPEPVLVAPTVDPVVTAPKPEKPTEKTERPSAVVPVLVPHQIELTPNLAPLVRSKSRANPPLFDFSLMGKEGVPGSDPDYFRFETEDGKTILLVPPDRAGFDVADISSTVVLDRSLGLIVPAPEKAAPEPPKLNLYPYHDAFTSSLLTGRPIVVFICRDDTRIDEVNKIVTEMVFRGAEKKFHISVINKTDVMCNKLSPGSVLPVEMIVWRKPNDKWVKTTYNTEDAFQSICARVIKWLRDIEEDKPTFFQWSGLSGYRLVYT